jgi:hypothetical protein
MRIAQERPHTPIEPGQSRDHRKIRSDAPKHKEVEAPKAPANVGAPVPAAQPAPREKSAFAKVLSGIGNELDRGERVMNRIRGGGGGSSLDGQELIALQVEVYRYNEVVDLTAKLVDRGTQGLKTVIQGQQ